MTDTRHALLIRQLGHAGLIPFVLLAATAWLVDAELQPWAAMAMRWWATGPGTAHALLDHGVATSLLDTPPEQAFDDLSMLARLVCDTPTALINLIDDERQWTKSAVGAEVSELPRSLSLCAHAILQPDVLMEVPDALADPRFAHNPMVTREGGLRFYAGVPLVTAEGHALGSLCVVDVRPRRLEAPQRDALRALARQVVTQLELRRLARWFQTQSTVDELTQVWNRRAFDQRLADEWARHGRRLHRRGCIGHGLGEGALQAAEAAVVFHDEEAASEALIGIVAHEEVAEATPGQIVIDIRHPDAQEDEPLVIEGVEVQVMPFYAINSRFKQLDETRQYLLYCDKGVMSRLHAHHLLSEGHANVRVYRPA